MKTTDDLVFVNRNAELDFFHEQLAGSGVRPALVVLRAPAGFGKSTLTDQLSKSDTNKLTIFCIVDPNIRGRAGSTSIHNGFFVQRVAEQLEFASAERFSTWPSLREFLAARKMKSMATKDPGDALSEMPSISTGYKLLHDYVSRAFSIGDFSPEKLLKSDAAEAVAICTSYAEHVLSSHSITLILRETQHIDLESLSGLLSWNQSHPGPNLIMEYTSESNEFEPEHQKLLLRAAQIRNGLDIFDLLRLDADHLEYLIRQSVRPDFSLSSEYYLAWNGNLRSVVEAKYRVSIRQSALESSQITRALSDLTGSLEVHILQLTSLERMVVAVVLAHSEAVAKTTISSILNEINSTVTHADLDKFLFNLENDHRFLISSHGSYALRSDTIAKALSDTASMRSLIMLAEQSIRDYYGNALQQKAHENGGVSLAVRQYLRLCAKTKDLSSLSRAIEDLSTEIRAAQDQSIYVEFVASAIEDDRDLFVGEFDALVEWAAELAYETSDWARAERLMQSRGEQNTYSRLVRACALQEIGGHSEALEIVAEVKGADGSAQTILAAQLVECLVIGCRGDHDATRNLLNDILDNERFKTSPLLGYALRFFEIVDGLEEGLPKLMQSIEWFEQHSLPKSRAYSQLPAAMLLARSGKVDQAKLLLADATAALSTQVRDQHILLNNSAAIDLLSDAPDFEMCQSQLAGALRFARDDFSELTILSNLGIANLGLNKVSEALSCAEKCKVILDEHDFADTDIYWPICLNMSVIFEAHGDIELSQAALEFAKTNAQPRTDDLGYWNFRYKINDNIPDSHSFLAGKVCHPVYLSHWMIDLEGLLLLK